MANIKKIKEKIVLIFILLSILYIVTEYESIHSNKKKKNHPNYQQEKIKN